MWKIYDTLDEFDDNTVIDAGRTYNQIRYSFGEKGIDLRNACAFISDGASTMQSPLTSFMARFRNNYANILIVNCPSHKMNRCAQNSMK